MDKQECEKKTYCQVELWSINIKDVFITSLCLCACVQCRLATANLTWAHYVYALNHRYRAGLILTHTLFARVFRFGALATVSDVSVCLSSMLEINLFERERENKHSIMPIVCVL